MRCKRSHPLQIYGLLEQGYTASRYNYHSKRIDIANIVKNVTSTATALHHCVAFEILVRTEMPRIRFVRQWKGSGII